MQKYLFILFFLFLGLNAHAQLCNGSLGDPIVNITFGAGSNPGQPLQAAATAYQFSSSDCPNDGYYTVRNNTNNCFSSSWHSLSNDHTGNQNGYFMLVNASVQPSAFYVEKVSGLCAGTTYEFAAWIINMLLPSACSPSPIAPDLTFTIEKTDGTVLQSYNTGNILTTSSPTWKQYGFFFTTPPLVTDVVIRIVNKAPGGCGNDLALDDITFRPCGPQLNASIQNVTGPSLVLCEGNSRNVNFACTVSSGFNQPIYQWQQRFNGGSWADISGATTTNYNQNFTTTQPIGLYEFRMSVAENGNMGTQQCRIHSQPVSVNVAPLPVGTIKSNSPICVGAELKLEATGGANYTWTGPNAFTSNLSNPSISPLATNQGGNYAVKIGSALGCFTNLSTNVQVNPLPSMQTNINSTTVCEQISVQLIASGATSYEWFPNKFLSANNIPNPIAIPLESTIYSVVGTNAAGCVDSAKIAINVVQKPTVNAGPDRFIIKGQSVELAGSIVGGFERYYWTPTQFLTNVTSLKPITKPNSDIQYILNVVAKNNCGIVTDTVDVKFYTGIFIPNSFTPNGDGLNDYWNLPFLQAFPDYSVQVYNRWGQSVFQGKGSIYRWDGKFKGEPMPTGVYTYFINLKKSPGILKGTLMLIR